MTLWCIRCRVPVQVHENLDEEAFLDEEEADPTCPFCVTGRLVPRDELPTEEELARESVSMDVLMGKAAKKKGKR